MSANADDVIPPSALQAATSQPQGSSVDDIIPPASISGADSSSAQPKPKTWFQKKMDMESNAFPVGASIVSAGSGALTDIGATGAVLKGLFSGDVKSLNDASRISEAY